MADPNRTELAEPDTELAAPGAGRADFDLEAYLRASDGLMPSALTGISAAWIGGLVAACTGTALAVVGLTLPWAQVRDAAQGRSYPVFLTSFNPYLGSGAAALLVMSAMLAGISFGSRSRLGAVLRSVTVVAATMWTTALLAATLYLTRGRTITVVDLWLGNAVRITVRGVALSVGALLYCVGTALLAGGTLGSVRLSDQLRRVPLAARDTAMIRGLRTGSRWMMTLFALGLAAASVALPWQTQAIPSDPADDVPVVVTGHDLHLWQQTYRIGLVAGILLYAAALVAAQARLRGAATALRAVGVMVPAVVATVLLVGLVAVRQGDAVAGRPVNYLDPTPHLGSGYLLAIAAMAALLCGVALIGSAGPPASIAAMADGQPTLDEDDG
ncbi:hypothetical protein [Plantactinospora siamensis]